MDLVIKNLPDMIERKIQALHILSQGQTNMNVLFGDAVVTMLDAHIAQYLSPGAIGVQMPANLSQDPHPLEMPDLSPPMPTRMRPNYEESTVHDNYAHGSYEGVAAQQAFQAQQAAPAAAARSAAAVTQPKVSSLGQQMGGNEMSFAEGLGDATDEYEAPDHGPEAEPTEDGPEPPPDEDDALVTGTAVNGPSDPEFDDLTGVPEDLDDDDDSLYADASASYTNRPAPRVQAPAAQTSLRAEDLGLPDLGSDAASMGFFDAQVTGGGLPAYARADRAPQRRAPVDDGGPRRPASLPAGEDASPTTMRRRPRVKVTGAK
jgi:hypothetical protein